MALYPDAANFHWIVEKSPAQAGYYLKSMNMKKCRAVAQGGSAANGAGIIQWDCIDASNHLWNFKQSSKVRQTYTLYCLLTLQHFSKAFL